MMASTFQQRIIINNGKDQPQTVKREFHDITENPIITLYSSGSELKTKKYDENNYPADFQGHLYSMISQVDRAIKIERKQPERIALYHWPNRQKLEFSPMNSRLEK